MEALARTLEPYKDQVGAAAGILTTGQMFAGSFICWDIYKQGNTKGIGIMPFVGGLIMSVINLKYGFVLRDDTMIRVNFIGLALNILYLMCYFNYSTEKTKTWLQIGGGGALSAAIVAYAQREDPALVEQRLGLIITVFMFYLIASPLFGLGEIIRTRSTAGLPFPIILSGSAVTASWLLYGVILRNNFIVVQNVVAFLLCAAQLSLFVIYPSKSKPSKGKGKAKKTN